MAIESSERRDVGLPDRPVALKRIAAGVNGFAEGDDAAALGAALAAVTGAELMLITINPQPLVILPQGLDWSSLQADAEAHLRQIRRSLAPDSRLVVDTDHSVPRALHRRVHRHHRDLLVVGSSRHVPSGQVRIGKRTRQMIGTAECALAVAPRGLRDRSEVMLRRIVVGYDGGLESRAALVLAASIAAAAQAALHVCAVVDDRVPIALGASLGRLALGSLWREAIDEYVDQLGQDARSVAGSLAPGASVEVQRGRPANVLLELGRDTDLLVIGSRRWGALSRVLLGSTGEVLLHDAHCPVIVVPRPGA